jgi:Uma2 family endonuclease
MDGREEHMETLIDLPEIEYLDGVEHPKVSPKYDHGIVQGAMIEVLRRVGRGHGTVVPELRCRLGRVDGTHTEFLPDVSFISTDQKAELSTADLQEPPFAPLVAVEVRSPSDRRGYRDEKIARYLATGSVLVLDVDPAAREIHAHSHEGVRTYAAGEFFAHESASWLAFDVAYIFADLD